MSPDRRGNATLLAFSLSAAAAILASQLLVAPVIGLADNGDYERIMGPAGFQHTTEDGSERYFHFLRTSYRVAEPGWSHNGYLSSETLLAFAARYLHLGLSRTSLFDLRLIGAIHSVLLLVALGLLIRACRDLRPATQIVVAGLLVFVFTDVGYVAPFNSFYSQTASLLFLLLTAGVAAEAVRRGRLSGPWLLAYFTFAILFVCSKPQEKLAAPLLALYGIRLAGVRFREVWRSAAAWMAVGLCAFAVWYGRQTPLWLREIMIYQVVFEDVLTHSPSPAEDARELGLDREWLQYAGVGVFTPECPLSQKTFRTTLLQRVGFRRILRFYARHPSRLADRLERSARYAWILRPPYGNFEESAGHPPLDVTTRFSSWSRARAVLTGPPFLWMGLLLGGNLAAALLTYRRTTPKGRLFREGVVLAVAMAGLAFAVCTLAQSPPDPARSLYAFQALCDLLLIADAGWLTERLSSFIAGRMS
jgi:hypothetical protein